MFTEPEIEEAAAGNSPRLQRVYERIRELAPKKAQEVDEQKIADAKSKIIALMESIPEGRERRKIFTKIRRIMSQERVSLDRERAEVTRHRDHLICAVDAADKIEEWLDGDLKLQKPAGTMMHSFRAAIGEGRIFDLPTPAASIPERDIAAWEELADGASVFMVEHDWARAFANAKDYIGGEIKLPDDSCAFEFRISDRHVITFATDADGTLYLQHAIQVKKGWLLLPVKTGVAEDDPFAQLTNLQVRAIAVALDAEIATAEIVRAPHKLNRARERAGKLPLVSYHIVNLAHRSRTAPLPPSDHEPAYHIRLHFRRGHWRHYENHKTWINWMLVGNPDLGFVDKEYRL
jgi:hypothetical protein